MCTFPLDYEVILVDYLVEQNYPHIGCLENYTYYFSFDFAKVRIIFEYQHVLFFSCSKCSKTRLWAILITQGANFPS